MILGLVGLIGSGKDTVADFLTAEMGFRRESFARPLKDAVAAVFNWDREMLEGRTEASRVWREQKDEWWSQRLGQDITPRKVLQLWGTEVCRAGYHNDIWVASLESRLKNSSQDVVITDCRFPNEIDAIQRIGGRVLRIQRGANPDWYYDARYWLMNGQDVRLMPDNLPHASEWSWIASNINGGIDNNGTIEQLHKNVRAVIDSFNESTYNVNVTLRNKEPV